MKQFLETARFRLSTSLMRPVDAPREQRGERSYSVSGCLPLRFTVPSAYDKTPTVVRTRHYLFRPREAWCGVHHTHRTGCQVSVPRVAPCCACQVAKSSLLKLGCPALVIQRRCHHKDHSNLFVLTSTLLGYSTNSVCQNRASLASDRQPSMK